MPGLWGAFKRLVYVSSVKFVLEPLPRKASRCARLAACWNLSSQDKAVSPYDLVPAPHAFLSFPLEGPYPTLTSLHLDVLGLPTACPGVYRRMFVIGASAGS